MIFQNQSGAGDVIQQIKKESLIFICKEFGKFSKCKVFHRCKSVDIPWQFASEPFLQTNPNFSDWRVT